MVDPYEIDNNGINKNYSNNSNLKELGKDNSRSINKM